MDKAETPRRAPQAWLDAIAKGEADYAAGRFSDLEPFLEQLHAEDAEFERQAQSAQGEGTKA